MSAQRIMLAAIAAAFGLGACQPAASDDKSFDARMKTYLLSHPQELRAALDNMQAKEDAAARAQAAAVAKAKLDQPPLRLALEHDPRDFVANPNGRVTVTEFYDFRCGHCINIAPKLIDLIRRRPDVRFVFKDLVIFGPTSARAAMAVIAAKRQGKDVLALYQDFMSTHPLTDDAIDRLAAKRGVDLSAMNDARFKADAQAQLMDNARLATQLSIDGTPGFVVGDDLIEGELYDDIIAAIAKAETKTDRGSQAYIKPAKGDDGSA
jgi:protein-disulfide isomerase